MRCPKCGKWSVRSVRYCPACGQTLKPKKEQTGLRKKRTILWLVFGSLGVLVLDLLAIGLTIQANPAASDSPYMHAHIPVISLSLTVFLCSSAVAFYGLLAKGMRFVVSNPKYLPIPILLLAGLALGGYLLYGTYASSNLTAQLPVLQASLAEATFAKFAGDALGDKAKTPPSGWSWKEVQKTAEAEAKILANLQGGPLDGYAKAATVWAAKIKDESVDRKDWYGLPDMPGDFAIRLKPEQAKELLKLAVIDIGGLKSFGDAAIVRKDRDTLLRIAAFLLVQRHWLDGLARYQEAGWLAQLVPPAMAYAVEGKQTCFTTWNGKPLCSIEVQGQLTDVYEAALAAANGEKDADKKWSESWKNAAQMAAEELAAHGHELEAMGEIGFGEETKPQRSPLEQYFIDRCTAAGGLVGGASQSVGPLLSTERGLYCGYKQGANNCWRFRNVSGDYYGGGDVGCLIQQIPLAQNNFIDACYAVGGAISAGTQFEDRLPTTESGMYCRFKQGARDCWRYLTMSGRDFAGGAAGCPELNLLPPALGPIIKPPTPPAQPASPPDSPPTQPAPVTQTAPKPTAAKPQTTKSPPPASAPAPTPSPSVPAPTPAPTPEPTPEPTAQSWQGTYLVTAWSGTCNSEQGKTWNFGSPYGGWTVDRNGQMCGMCGCATVSPSGSYLLECTQRQAWGTNMWKLSATFSRSGDAVTVNGTLWEKNYRVTSEFGSQIEPGSTYICNANFSFKRR